MKVFERRLVRQGAVMPRGFARGWLDPVCGGCWCYRTGIHILVAAWMRVTLRWDMFRAWSPMNDWDDKWERAVRVAHHEGYCRAMSDALKDAMKK